jgi:hypothetical protein
MCVEQQAQQRRTGPRGTNHQIQLWISIFHAPLLSTHTHAETGPKSLKLSCR